MIDKVNNNQISDILRDGTARKLKGRKPSEGCKLDASLQISYEPLIEKAQQESAEDANAVERARQLLLSGELDTPENIREAAKNIVRFGI